MISANIKMVSIYSNSQVLSIFLLFCLKTKTEALSYSHAKLRLKPGQIFKSIPAYVKRKMRPCIISYGTALKSGTAVRR